VKGRLKNAESHGCLRLAEGEEAMASSDDTQKKGREAEKKKRDCENSGRAGKICTGSRPSTTCRLLMFYQNVTNEG